MGGERGCKTQCRFECCKGVQHFCFNTGFEGFKYSVFVARRKPAANRGVRKTYLDDLAVNGGGEGESLLKLILTV